MTAGAVIGWHPSTTLEATLPELMFSVDGWRQAHGLSGEKRADDAMNMGRLHELIERDAS